MTLHSKFMLVNSPFSDLGVPKIFTQLQSRQYWHLTYTCLFMTLDNIPKSIIVLPDFCWQFTLQKRYQNLDTLLSSHVLVFNLLILRSNHLYSGCHTHKYETMHSLHLLKKKTNSFLPFQYAMSSNLWQNGMTVIQSNTIPLNTACHKSSNVCYK
jgi:hypothetical protein